MSLRSKILETLRKAGGQAVSGEEIAAGLGVSRTAIWKHIKGLRADGYAIESRARSGYALGDSPDLLSAEEILPHLRTKWLGRKILYFEETRSTNEELKKKAHAGAEEGTVAVAELQTDGHGRLSRSWISPRGKGALFSLLLRPDFLLPQDAPKCTLLAAVAVARAIRAQGVAAGIKWPNDILVDGKKVVGILTEMSAEMERVHHIVIGVGVNVNLDREDFPPDLQETATSLKICKGENLRRAAFLAGILEEAEQLYEEVRAHGFGAALEAWRALSVTLGQEVRVIGVAAQEEYTGTAVDIDADGALLVDTKNGRQRVLAGDVSIRPRNRAAENKAEGKNP